MPQSPTEDSQYISAQYQAQGFVVLRRVFAEEELRPAHAVLQRFHKWWLKSNAALYQARAINSAYLTDRKILNHRDRLVLFQLLGDARIARIIKAVFPSHAAFMNTQLFFNPSNSEQKNYWHRDIQYSGMPLEEQILKFKAINVIHLRLALMPERGVELMPQTHQRWDTDVEFAVRMAADGNRVHDALPDSCTVSLERGDILVFSANMIHRGLYGAQRMAFDMLFCEPLPELLQFVNPDCLPNMEDLKSIECPDPFIQTQKALSKL